MFATLVTLAPRVGDDDDVYYYNCRFDEQLLASPPMRHTVKCIEPYSSTQARPFSGPALPYPRRAAAKTKSVCCPAMPPRPCPAIPAPGRRERQASSRVFASGVSDEASQARHFTSAFSCRKGSHVSTRVGRVGRGVQNQTPASVIASGVSDEVFIVGRYCARFPLD